MDDIAKIESINILPGVSMLSVLQRLNYKAWFALAEFVDNSIQSFIFYKDALKQAEGSNFVLRVEIEIDTTDKGRIIIRDNAAGIHKADYPRAFRPAAIPPDRSGLSEYGMGMKSAACWFSQKWTVRTSALGEPIERIVAFDINNIVKDDLEELKVEERAISPSTHFTEIILTELNQLPQKKTVAKIKEHLTSIYRIFIREGSLLLTYSGETLKYTETKILCAPHYKNPTGEPLLWRKEINFDFGLGQKVYGFAALRDEGSHTDAGFALFRRNRLIEGSTEEGYRPPYIFSSSNSFTHQRLFGELHLNGFEVSHTKDGFRWDEQEEVFLQFLKEEINKDPLPLIRQAEGYRAKQRPADLSRGATIAVDRTAETIKQEVPKIVERQLETKILLPDQNLPPVLPTATMASKRVIKVELQNTQWEIAIELSTDPAVGDWLSISDRSDTLNTNSSQDIRRVELRMALAHPFMEQFGGTEAAQIEPILRIAAAMGLAEIVARSGGAKYVSRVRQYVNELLKDALSKP